MIPVYNKLPQDLVDDPTIITPVEAAVLMDCHNAKLIICTESVDQIFLLGLYFDDHDFVDVLKDSYVE